MVADKWLRELPQQFQDKRKIEVIIRAFGRQIDELYEVFQQLKTETTLDKAVGKNLDYVGDILSTTRKDAQAILMVATGAEITDDVYRQVLRYKARQNNCDCTYYDIMESINLLWNTNNVKYSENPAHPATVYISLPEVGLDGMDPAAGRVLAIRPSGVNMVYATGFADGINIGGSERITASMIRSLYWKLDGRVLLDGSKMLDAQTVEEVL